MGNTALKKKKKVKLYDRRIREWGNHPEISGEDKS